MLVSVVFGDLPWKCSQRGNTLQSFSDNNVLSPSTYNEGNDLAVCSCAVVGKYCRSGQVRMQEAEVFNLRADLAVRMSPFVSRDWILRRIFRFSQEEIQNIEAQCALDSLVR